MAEDAVFLALLECIARSFGFAGSFVGSFACCVRSHVRSGWLVRSWVRSPFVFVRTFVRACWFVVEVSCSLVGAEIRSNRGPNQPKINEIGAGGYPQEVKKRENQKKMGGA